VNLALTLVLLLAATPAGKAAPMSDLSALERTIRTTWDFHDPAATEKKFVAMADSLKADPAAALLVRTQVARAQGLQMRYDDANATLDLVQRDLFAVKPAAEAELHLQARERIERGRVLNTSGDPTKARPLFEQAFALADSARQEGLAVDAAHMVAIAAFNDSAHADALAWNERALALAEASKDPEARRWRASLLNNLAWTHHDMKDYKAALPLFERALAARREEEDVRSVREARWAVARCLRSLGRYDEALKEQQALEAECAKANEPDGFVYEELGELLYAKGQKEEAKPWFAKAWTELNSDPYIRYNEVARLKRIKELSGTTP
jgi:tetratricopeptide (TPR) repeat protein